MGLKPCEFWVLTFFELVKMAEGYVKCQKQHYNDLIYLAWHCEAFARTKKLPSLESIMQKTSVEQHKEQSDDEMLVMAKLLNAAFGGEVVEN
jgi:hypothetical protein